MDLPSAVSTTSPGMSAMMNSTRPNRGTQTSRLRHKEVRDPDGHNPGVRMKNVTTKLSEHGPVSHGLLQGSGIVRARQNPQAPSSHELRLTP